MAGVWQWCQTTFLPLPSPSGRKGSPAYHKAASPLKKEVLGGGRYEPSSHGLTALHARMHLTSIKLHLCTKKWDKTTFLDPHSKKQGFLWPHTSAVYDENVIQGSGQHSKFSWIAITKHCCYCIFCFISIANCSWPSWTRASLVQ